MSPHQQVQVQVSGDSVTYWGLCDRGHCHGRGTISILSSVLSYVIRTGHYLSLLSVPNSLVTKTTVPQSPPIISTRDPYLTQVSYLAKRSGKWCKRRPGRQEMWRLREVKHTVHHSSSHLPVTMVTTITVGVGGGRGHHHGDWGLWG